MKSIVRWRGVKSPNTGWQCESISPGITVVPRASITVSASPSSPRPTAAMRPSIDGDAVAVEERGARCRRATICPMFVISVFIDSHVETSRYPPTPSTASPDYARARDLRLARRAAANGPSNLISPFSMM